ncbi:hypothetical protein KEM54_000386 [Ascosphaera aggregata]|nr:hypothetical protein KEM54_000386 [Ascosphaera aggregata]
MSLCKVSPSSSWHFLLSSSPARTCAAQWQARRWNSSVAAEDTGYGSYSSAREAKYRGQERSERLYSSAIAASTERSALFKNQTRNWKPGDVYSPRDMLPGEMRKWRTRQSPSVDVFDHLRLNPLDLYKVRSHRLPHISCSCLGSELTAFAPPQNFSVMSEYVTDMGRIKHSSETGLRPVNQRKIAKAIRRAIGLGLMPTVHKHPEILIDYLQRRER